MKSILRVLHGTVEVAVPDWVEQSRRLGGLLIGVANQAGRPISLAKEWEPIARQLLRDHAAGRATGAQAGRAIAAAQVATTAVAAR